MAKSVTVPASLDSSQHGNVWIWEAKRRSKSRLPISNSLRALSEGYQSLTSRGIKPALPPSAVIPPLSAAAVMRCVQAVCFRTNQRLLTVVLCTEGMLAGHTGNCSGSNFHAPIDLASMTVFSMLNLASMTTARRVADAVRGQTLSARTSSALRSPYGSERTTVIYDG